MIGLSRASLFIQMRVNGHILSSGTGFACNTACGPALITNRHNVTGRNQHTNAPLNERGLLPNEIVIMQNLPQTREGYLDWRGAIEHLFDENDRPRWIEHPALGPRADFVALPLLQKNGWEFLFHDPNAPQRLMLGPADVVSVIGFPFGKTAGGYLGIWATGFVASEPMVDFSDLPAILIDCRTRQGQSGSPVVAFRNGGAVAMKDGSSGFFSGPVFDFIGIYSGRLSQESDLGLVWKASAIAELLSSIGPPSSAQA